LILLSNGASQLSLQPQFSVLREKSNQGHEALNRWFVLLWCWNYPFWEIYIPVLFLPSVTHQLTQRTYCLVMMQWKQLRNILLTPICPPKKLQTCGHCKLHISTLFNLFLNSHLFPNFHFCLPKPLIFNLRGLKTPKTPHRFLFLKIQKFAKIRKIFYLYILPKE
jgi:hypothetical protein